AYDAFTRPGLLLTVFAITVVSAGFHEFGHAAALRRGGGTPGAMGAGLYLVWPAFYTDVTDSYRLGRGARLRTDLGGLYFKARVVVTAWVLLVVPLLLFSVVMMVVALPRLLATTAHSVSAQSHLLSARMHAGDTAGAVVKGLAIAALVVPVAGMLLMLVRSVR